MTKVMAGVVVVLIVIAGLFGWLWKGEVQKRLTVQRQLDVVAAVNATSQDTIKQQRLELDNRDALATEMRKRYEMAVRESAGKYRQLEKLKNENESLRKYLSGVVPRLVADWLWLGGKAGRNKNRGGAVNAAEMDDGANAYTAKPVPAVTHEEGWKWCRSVEQAVKSCNQDKAALRRWQKAKNASAAQHVYR